MATKRQLSKSQSNGNMPAGYTQRSGSFPSQWEPEIGDTLHGKLTDYRTIETKFGESEVVTITEDKTGLDWSVFLSAGLTGRLTKRDKGKRVYLKRMEDRKSKKKGRKPMKTYLVGVGK